MKKRNVSRILEGAFLFTLVLMFYLMSFFTAEGQMKRELVEPSDLLISFSNEESFMHHRIMQMNLTDNDPTTANNHAKPFDLFAPIKIKEKTEISEHQFFMLKHDQRRRRNREFLPPLLIIPLD